MKKKIAIIITAAVMTAYLPLPGNIGRSNTEPTVFAAAADDGDLIITRSDENTVISGTANSLKADIPVSLSIYDSAEHNYGNAEELVHFDQIVTGAGGVFSFSVPSAALPMLYTAAVRVGDESEVRTYSAEQYLLSDNFEDYTGGISSKWAWCTGTGSRFTAENIDAEHGTSLGMKALSGLGGTVMEYDFEEPLSPDETYRLSFSVCADSPEGLFYIRILDDRYTAMNSANDGYMHETFCAESSTAEDGTVSARLGYYINSTGWSSDKLCSWDANKWYDIDMWLDQEHKKIYYVVNNELLAETEFSVGNALKGLLFIQTNADKKIYLDNLSVEYATRSNIRKWLAAGDTVPEQLKDPIDIKLFSDTVGNIFYDDDAAELTLSLKNKELAAADVNYRAVLTDMQSNEVWSNSDSVHLNSFEQKQLKISPEITKYGVYTLDIYIDGNEEPRCTQYVSRSVRNSQVNEKIAVCTHFDRARGDSKTCMDLIEAAGIGYVRTDWPRNETAVGEYSDYYETNGRFSAYIKESLEKGIGMYCLIGVNGSSDLYPLDSDGGFNTSEAALRGLTSFCRYMADKFKGKVEYFEIGNEVNFIKNSNRTGYDDLSSIPEAEDYAKILEAAYKGIKDGNPEAKVVAFASSITYSGVHAGSVYEAFVRRSLDTMKKDGTYWFDAISLHPYHIAGAPEYKDIYSEYQSWIDKGNKIKKIVDEYGLGDKEIIASELGYSYQRGEGAEKTAYMVRMMALNEVNDFYSKLFFYDFQDDGTDTTNSEHNYGMITTWKNVETTYAAKEFYPAVSFWNKLMNGAAYVEKDESTYERTYKFDCTDKTVNVLWNIENGQTEQKSERTLSTGGKRAYVYDMYGNLIDTADDTVRVTVGSVPVYVVMYKDMLFSVKKSDGSEVGWLSGLSVGSTLNVSCNSEFAKDGATLIAAVYKDERFCGISYRQLFNAGESLEITYDGSYDKLKLMLWKDLGSTIKPLEDARTITK